MSIETEFESTITNVKNAYQGLDNLGATIPQNKTIENIKSCLDEIYNKFPKTDYAEGSNITLSNTLKGKLDFEDGIVGYGDTKQYTTTGINLCECKMVTQEAYGITLTNNNNGTYTISGTNTRGSVVGFRINQSTISGTDNLQDYDNGTYTLDIGITNENLRFSIMQMNTWTEFLPTGFGTRLKSGTISSATNTFLLVQVKEGASFSTPVTIKPMLVSGSYTESTIPPFEPYTGGIPSPNPSYPQDIEVVRGKNRFGFVNNSSRTWFGLTMTWTDSSITINGTSTNTESVYAIGVDLKPIKLVGTYKLSGYIRNDDFAQLYWKDKNGTIKYQTMKNNPTITFNEGDTLYQMFFFASKGNILTFNNETFNIQLEKGSQATSYLPYNTLEVKARGKNHLLCRTDISIGYTRTDNGITWQRTGENTFKLNGTASSDFTLIIGTATPLMEYLKTGETYTLSGCPSGGSDSTYRLQIFNYNGLNSAFDTGNGATFVANIPNTSNVAIRVFNGTTVNNLEFNAQIELGSTKTSFIPFEVTTQQLSLGEYEFARIGNYVDTIEYDVENDKVYKNVAIKKLVLDGSETITNDYTAFDIPLPNRAVLGEGAYCNYYIYDSRSSGMASLDNYKFAFQAVKVFIQNKDFSSVDSFKNWLSTNKPIIYYPLYTAQKEEITTTLKDQIKEWYNSQSFTGTTIIEIDGQLPLIIKARALKGN